MEGKYLVTLKENGTSNVSVYGTVNPCCEDGQEKSTENNDTSFKEESSFQRNMIPSPVENSCACPPEKDCSEIDCGQKKIQFESWARYKTITMAIGLSVFGIWIIVIAVIAKQGKL